MKLKHSFFSTLSALAIMMFASSCSTTVSVSKRHYNSGFYVDISSKKSNVGKQEVKASQEEITLAAKVENSERAVATTSEQVASVKKIEVKEASGTYFPLNRKEKITTAKAAKPLDFATSIKLKESKVFARTNSSGLQDSKTMFDGNKHLTLWLIFLLAAIILTAVGAGFLGWLAWIAFLVFFIMWLIDVLG